MIYVCVFMYVEVYRSVHEHMCGGLYGGQRSISNVVLPDLPTLLIYLPVFYF